MQGILKSIGSNFPMKHVADRNKIRLKENASARMVPSTFFWQILSQLNEEDIGA